VQRRAVDRPIGPGEDPFKERTYELTKTDEEPVISKTAHVTGEVALTKEATEHAEVIRETVRRSEVEVEELRPEDVRRGATEAWRSEDARRGSTEPWR
jgi:stress response protein YsnF